MNKNLKQENPLRNNCFKNDSRAFSNHLSLSDFAIHFGCWKKIENFLSSKI